MELEHRFALEEVLPLVRSNTAQVLRLGRKGRLEAGADADVVVLEAGSLEVVEVIAQRGVSPGRSHSGAR